MKIRLLDWRDLKMSDDNDGYIYGIEETDLIPPDYIEWFKTKKERNQCIKDNNFEVE